MTVSAFDVNAFVYNTRLSVPPPGASSTVTMTNVDANINKLYYSTISANATNDANGDGRFNVGETVTLTDHVGSAQNVVKSVTTLNVLGSGRFTWTSSLAPGFGGTADVLVTSDGSKTYLVFVNGDQRSHYDNNHDRTGASGPRIGELINSSTLTWRAVGYEPGEGPLCFGRGTLIDTDRGGVAIELLRVGDRVLTRDNGAQPIRWIGSMILTAGALAADPRLRPIKITADSLGAGLPARDLVVSPQHRVVVRSKIAKRMFDADEVFVPAVKLTALPGVFVDTECGEVEYFHMLFDRHEIVTSNGAQTESLHTGRIALRSLSTAARDEIFAIFPELAETGQVRALARPVPKGREIGALLHRHVKNAKPLQAAG
ncbi:Hint domain-containing protein [Paracoccus stylophorae]|nr:Hint domain-containing protein [Paracoccus stylophorae]